ncbi:MAG: hypothetical protein IPL73_04040 [Candidatus Obscuribacter sp.]|jgi:hypothetical protein|nr:hypothetical protein [Candidatus Obscuribacter sp.]MBK9619910.1 hypothetical protein [Candidatus Obscuribacter sp.]
MNRNTFTLFHYMSCPTRLIRVVTVFYLVLAFIAFKIQETPVKPITSAAQAITFAEERMKESGYADEPSKARNPTDEELGLIMAGKLKWSELRRHYMNMYGAKAVAYSEMKDGWSVGFPDSGRYTGEDSGVCIHVYKNGTFDMMLDPSTVLSSHQHQLK